MIEFEFRPIDQWPGNRSLDPKGSQFSAPHSDTLVLLDRELRQLNARNIIIQADCDGSQIRRDGMLKADARLRSQGIILSFDSKSGPLSFPCDRFNHWQQNLRAIALALEALRKVDRYGVTRSAEQYRGWSKLPAPPASVAMTPHEAAAILEAHAARPGINFSHLLTNPEICREVSKAAVRDAHPDRNGGDDSTFKIVQQAREVLEQHHARRA